MSSLLLFGLMCLAGYRVTRIVTGDTISEPYREQLRALVPDEERWWTSRAGYLLQLVECPWCFGWWISLALVAWCALLLDVPLPLLQAPAVACVVGMIGSRFDG